MHARLHGRHGFQLALQQREGRAHRCVGRHVADLHVCDGAEAPTLVSDLVQQRQQHLTWLLVGERHDVVFDRAGGDVHVAELARGDRSVVALDPQPPGFQPAGQVRQRAGVDQLTYQAGASACVAADQVDQAQTVCTEAHHIGVLHEVLALELELVVFLPVTANGQHLRRGAVYRDDVGPGNAVLVLMPGHVVVDMNLKELVALVVCKGIPLVLGLVLLDVGGGAQRGAEVHVAIKPAYLQLTNLILRLAHHVGDTLRGHGTRRAIGDDDVFGWAEDRRLAPQTGVVVHLLERRAGQPQGVQQALMLGPVLGHLLRQAEVHVVAHPVGRVLAVLVRVTDNLGLDRAGGWERLDDRLGLEPDGRFC